MIQVVRVYFAVRLMLLRVEKYSHAHSHVSRDWYVTGFQHYYKRDWIPEEPVGKNGECDRGPN